MLKTSMLLSTVALSLGLAASPAAGQASADSMMVERVTPRWTTGSMNFQVGSAHLGLDDLNRTLTANGRPAFSANVATVGVSSTARLRRLMIGVTGESALPQRELSAGWVNKISFGSAMATAGVVLLERAHFSVYPQASVGMRKTSLKMERVGDMSYDAAVQDPARGMAISSRSALTEFGLVAEGRFNTKRTGAFSIGLKAGAVQPLGQPVTSAGESAVNGTPREGAGRYLRLSIGKPIGKRKDAMSALSTALLSIITG